MLSAWAVPILLFIAIATIGIGCARNPATGDSEFILVSEEQEIALGRESNQAILNQFGQYGDRQLEAYVQAIGHELAAESERPDLPWEFHVLDSPVVNAFALPGGFIYITRGMLAILNSEAQLAGVLGHEIGHVTARHSAQQISRSQLAQLGLGLGSIFIEDFDQYGQVAGAGLGLLFLQYGRDDEREADLLGVRYAARIGYDPREIPDTYRSLQRLQEQSGQSIPDFLSTHPDPGERADRTTQLANEAVARMSSKPLVAAADYKRRMEDLVYGNDPRQGFVEGNVFYHPAMRFQWRLPSDWQVENLPRSVTVMEPAGEAAIQLTLVARNGTASPGGYVERLRSEGDITAAQGSRTSVGGWPAWIGTITFTDSQGQTSTLHAAWIARESDAYYQFVGGPGTSRVGSVFGESVSTFSELRDPEMLAREPDRVHVASVDRSEATLEYVVGQFPLLSVPVQEVAFLNGLWPDTVLDSGTLVKLVLAPRL